MISKRTERAICVCEHHRSRTVGAENVSHKSAKKVFTTAEELLRYHGHAPHNLSGYPLETKSHGGNGSGHSIKNLWVPRSCDSKKIVNKGSEGTTKFGVGRPYIDLYPMVKNHH